MSVQAIITGQKITVSELKELVDSSGDMLASVYDPAGGEKQVVFTDDSRLSDARTPTSHEHAGEDITSGTISNGRLPTVTIAHGGTGQTSSTKALYALINGPGELEAVNIADNDYIGVVDTSEYNARKVKISEAKTLFAGDKQAKITASGILKGNGAGGVSGAVAGTDYVDPSDSRLSDARTPTAHTHTLSAISDFPGDFGSLFPNFDEMTPVLTATYTVSSIDPYEICRRANTGLSSEADFNETVLFRITVTGTGIRQQTDFIMQGSQALNFPYCYAVTKTLSGESAYSGIKYLYFRTPRVLNSGREWTVDLTAYNAAERTVRVDVYKTSPEWTWNTALTPTSYDVNYHIYTTMTLQNNRGICALGSQPLTVSQATAAGYVSAALPLFTSGTQVIAGQALPANSLIIQSGDRLYPASDKTKAIIPEVGLIYTSVAAARLSAPGYSALRQKGSWTDLGGDANMGKNTIARGNPVYLRCTLDANGNIFSDAYLDTAMSPGYTWCYVGVGQSATAINVDTTHSLFLTLDSAGKLTHVNGRALSLPAHEHSADDITSGTLPISRGGTGKSSTQAAIYSFFASTNVTQYDASDAADDDLFAFADVSANLGRKIRVSELKKLFSPIFVVNFFLHDSLLTYIADKTYNEVNEAIENGKIVMASLTTYDFGEDPLEKTPNAPIYTYAERGIDYTHYGQEGAEQIIFLSSHPVMNTSVNDTSLYDNPTYVSHDIIALRNNDTIIRVTKTLNYA